MNSNGHTGVITSVGSNYVFVRYGNDTVSKATRAKDLILEKGR